MVTALDTGVLDLQSQASQGGRWTFCQGYQL